MAGPTLLRLNSLIFACFLLDKYTQLESIQANLVSLLLRGSNQNRGSSRGRSSNRGGRNTNNGRGNQVRGGNRLVFQLCGKHGHSVHKCYHRFDVHFTGEPPAGTDNNTPPPAQAKCLSDRGQSCGAQLEPLVP